MYEPPSVGGLDRKPCSLMRVVAGASRSVLALPGLALQSPIGWAEPVADGAL